MTDSKPTEAADLPASLASNVREFYLGASLDAERVDELLASRELAVSMIRWRRMAVASSVGLAAMTLLAIGLLIDRSNNERPVIAQEPNAASVELPISPPPSGATTPPMQDVAQQDPTQQGPPTPVSVPDEPSYLLVAFRSHGQGCPFCRETGKAFRDVETRIDRDLVQLEEFHLGDPSSAQENEARLDAYNLDPLVASRTETAFLALTTRDGEVVERFKPTLGGEEIARRVNARVAK